MLKRLLKSEKFMILLLMVAIVIILLKEVGEYDIAEYVFAGLVVLILTSLFLQYTED